MCWLLIRAFPSSLATSQFLNFVVTIYTYENQKSGDYTKPTMTQIKKTFLIPCGASQMCRNTNQKLQMPMGHKKEVKQKNKTPKREYGKSSLRRVDSTKG